VVTNAVGGTELGVAYGGFLQEVNRLSWTYVGPGGGPAPAPGGGGGGPHGARPWGGAEALLLAALAAAGGFAAAQYRSYGGRGLGVAGVLTAGGGGRGSERAVGGRIEQVYDETGDPALGGAVAEAAYAPMPSEDSVNLNDL
jgi:hypothetical protein